jgi:hypothetical protein
LPVLRNKIAVSIRDGHSDVALGNLSTLATVAPVRMTHDDDFRAIIKIGESILSASQLQNLGVIVNCMIAIVGKNRWASGFHGYPFKKRKDRIKFRLDHVELLDDVLSILGAHTPDIPNPLNYSPEFQVINF